MTTRERVFRFFLWWAVLGYAVWVGGTVFSMLVIVPLWSASPPESVREFFQGTNFNRTVGHFFGPPWMVLRNLPVLGALVAGWPYRIHRRYLLVSAACLLVAVVFTLAYVYRINEVLMIRAGGAAGPDEIRRMVRQWIFADRLRFGVGFVGFLFLLRAFRTPVPGEPTRLTS